MKVLCIADGFGDSWAVPQWYPNYLKWPEIISLMTRGVDLVNHSRYGAGNEYISHCLRQNLDTVDLVLVQWAMPNRLDLVLSQDNLHEAKWRQEIAKDNVYKDNIVNLGTVNYWISSASVLPLVKEYHSTYISVEQHRLRSQLSVEHAKLLLNARNIDYRFLLTVNSSYLGNTIEADEHWCWHQPWQGMDDFRHHSEFANLDLGITQPIPLIAFDFIKKYIMPVTELPWRKPSEIDAVENMLHRHYKIALEKRP